MRCFPRLNSPVGRRPDKHLWVRSQRIVRRNGETFPATDTEPKRIAAAAIMGESRIPKNGYGTSLQGNVRRVVDKGEAQVLLDVTYGRAACPPGAQDVAKIPIYQGDARTFHRDIRPDAHRNPESTYIMK